MNGEGGLVHLVREPASEPEGALILMHGRATGERDLFPLLDELDPGRRLVGLAPGGPLTDQPPGGRHWYIVERVGQPDEPTFLETMRVLCRFLDDFLRSRGVPWERTVIGGFSQGAAVALSAAFGTARPAAAGVLAMSGFVPTVRGWRLDIRSKRGETHAYVTHGAFDNVIPVGFGRRTRDLLSEEGIDVHYRETRVLHSVDPTLLPEMREWVSARVADTYPGPDEGPKAIV